MRARSLSILVILAILILAACAQDIPTPAAVPTGPRPSGSQPSPSTIVSAAATVDPGPPPAAIDSTTTVATEVAPGWVQYEGINGILDRAFAPDDALWMRSQHGVARFDPAVAVAEVEGFSPDAAWTVYLSEDGLQGGGFGSIAFGPGGEIWFGSDAFPAAGGKQSCCPLMAGELLHQARCAPSLFSRPGQNRTRP